MSGVLRLANGAGWRPGAAHVRRHDYEAVAAEATSVVDDDSDAQVGLTRSFRSIALSSVAVFALGGMAMLFAGVFPSHGMLRSHPETEFWEFASWRGVSPCNLVEHGVEYQTRGSVVGQYDGIVSDTQCRLKCFEVPDCHIWSWTPAGRCTLKGLGQHEEPGRWENSGVISGGLPCQMDELRKPGTLYCWALMVPDTYEQGLLAMQFAQRTSIFACEEYSVFTNVFMEISPGLYSDVVNTTLAAPSGGEFMTALNTDIFIAVWRKVVDVGKYALHEWTVKADADTVFLPQRLRKLLPHHPKEERGVYLNNCKFGMHGPLEVFSKEAVDALNRNWQSCLDYFFAKCQGDCKWGEDLFIDQCLQKVVHVRRDDEWSLLEEDHCMDESRKSDGEWSYYDCDATHVAFHPFKGEADWAQCLSNAVALEAQTAAA